MSSDERYMEEGTLTLFVLRIYIYPLVGSSFDSEIRLLLTMGSDGKRISPPLSLSISALCKDSHHTQSCCAAMNQFWTGEREKERKKKELMVIVCVYSHPLPVCVCCESFPPLLFYLMKGTRGVGFTTRVMNFF